MQGSVGDPSVLVRSPSLAPVSAAGPGEALERGERASSSLGLLGPSPGSPG